MHSLKRLLPNTRTAGTTTGIKSIRLLSKRPTGDDEWNEAWESAWLPDEVSAKHRAPWETDVTLPSASAAADLDDDTKAFVAEMDERWIERRAAKTLQRSPEQQQKAVGSRKAGDDYRVTKQKIHASLWTKEIEKMEESRLGGPGAADDIDRLLDSCSEIFDAGNFELSNSTGLKTKPDGWETTSKTKEGNIWDMSQNEEDILLQEFERRIAFSKFQIASFIKTHIFSRRRPIDGWKYMIEEIGPNARKGKGSVQRPPTLADPATQPFREEKTNTTPFKGRR